MEIGANPDSANAAMEEFAAKTGKSLGYVQAQFKDYQAAESAAYDEAVRRARGTAQDVDKSLLNNRESVRLLSEEMGIRLPRAVSGALAEMLPGINAIGPALLGAFALAELPKFIESIRNAATALGGYTEEVRKAEKADIDASTAALVHFTTIARGTLLIAQTNAALANLAAKQGNWKEEAKAANAVMSDTKSVFTSLLGPVSEVINLYRGYKAAVKESSDTEGQAAQLRERLNQQLDQMAKLQDKAHKDAAQAAKDAARQEEESAEKLADWISRKQREIQKWAEEAPKAVRELTAGAKAYDAALAASHQHEIEHNLFLEKMARDEMALLPLQQRSIDLARQEIQVLTVDETATKHLSAARKELIWVTQSARDTQRQWVGGVREEIDAIRQDMNAAERSFTSGLAGLIAGRRAQAGVEALWETARGIACIAEGTWPPNPAALLAAGLHFEAAAQFAMMAGTSSHHHGGAGAGAGSYRSDVDHDGYSGGRSDYGMPPQTLAPGAASQGGRFGSVGSGIIVVHGSTDLHQMVAGLVNGAVDRGITVNSTTAQRGSPVGH